jgi:serine/threonine protein kinase
MASAIAITENSEVYPYNKGEVIKKMKFNGATAREVSLSKALQNCPVSLNPRKEVLDGGKIGLIYPLTKDFSLEENKDYEDVFMRCIQILAVLEKSGIAHLDFLPDNLCYHGGEILVRDFGNAYLFSNRQGFVHTGRYPRIQICAPEFQNFPEPKDYETFIPEVQIQDPNDLFYEPQNGSYFDQRADVWSLGCWMYLWFEGFWPVNHPSDYFVIKTKNLQKYGKVGSYVADILTSSNRPWASQICQELSIIVPSFELVLPKTLFLHKVLTDTSTLESDFPQIEINDQMVWILTAAQRSEEEFSIKDIISLFLNDESWDPKTIKIFEKLNFQIYTNNLLKSSLGFPYRKKYYDLLKSPGEFQDSNIAMQMERIIQDKQLSNYVI